jgi:hypothetical protein
METLWVLLHTCFKTCYISKVTTVSAAMLMYMELVRLLRLRACFAARQRRPCNLLHFSALTDAQQCATRHQGAFLLTVFILLQTARNVLVCSSQEAQFGMVAKLADLG